MRCPNPTRHHTDEKIYEKTWFTVLLLIVFYPVGVFLMWKYAKWDKDIKIIVTILVAVFFVCSCTYVLYNNFLDVGDAINKESSISENNQTEVEPTINMDDQTIDKTNAKLLVDTLNKNAAISWEYSEYGSYAGKPIYIGELREPKGDSTIGLIKIKTFIITDRDDEIWEVEIKQNGAEGQYSLFYDAVDAIKNDSINNKNVRDWLDNNINIRPENDKYHTTEIQSGDAVFELSIHGSLWRGEKNKDITLTIKGVGYDEYSQGRAH